MPSPRNLWWRDAATDRAERRQPKRLCIAIYESQISPVRRTDLNALVCEPDDYQEAEEDPKPAEEEREGAEISKVKFEELKKRMPVRLLSHHVWSAS